jgi:hypothetical protein
MSAAQVAVSFLMRATLGAETERVLTEMLELPPERIAALRAGGAVG